MIEEVDIVIRLVLASIIGGLIGLEREIKNRPAGLRTHILVAIGATLTMLVSKYGFSEYANVDPSRLAAQVISGIGFLGAGTIIMTGPTIHGLTTAASLWTTACIGLAVGAGYYVGVAVSTVLVLFTLVVLLFLEKYIFKYRFKNMRIEAVERPGLIADIGDVFEKHNLLIKNMEVNPKNMIEDEGLIQEIKVMLNMADWMGGNTILSEIQGIEGVRQVEWV